MTGGVAASCLSLYGFLCPCTSGIYINEVVTWIPCTQKHSTVRSPTLTPQGRLDVPLDHATGRCCPIYRLGRPERTNRVILTPAAKAQRNIYLLLTDACHEVFRCYQLVILSQKKRNMWLVQQPSLSIIFSLQLLIS